MYSIIDTENGRLMLKLPTCKKVFTSEGKIVKFGKNGMVLLPKESKIAVCKILPFVYHQVRMAKNKQLLHYNSVIVNYELGQEIPFDEEELLLASLEVVEVL